VRVNEVGVESLRKPTDRGTDREAAEAADACQPLESANVVHGCTLHRRVARRESVGDDRHVVAPIDQSAGPAGDVDRAAVGYAEQPEGFPGHGRRL
jgi:hypothetical protein